MLKAVFEIEGVDKGSKCVQGEYIAEYLAQLIDPQKGEFVAKEIQVP